MSNVSGGKRPEGSRPPELFYDDVEAKKYNASSRMISIQKQITERALQMLALPPGKSCYILDVGCGTGLSGMVLEDAGHHWVGCDISSSMLQVAAERRTQVYLLRDSSSEDEADKQAAPMTKQSSAAPFYDEEYEDESIEEDQDGAAVADDDGEDDADHDEYDEEMGAAASPGGTNVMEGQGDLLRVDAGQGLPFQPGTFDGVISVSALQWLCYASSSEQNPIARLNRFFSSLYAVLKKNGKAVLQFYPETSEQAVLIAQAASRVGFAGGVVVDYPNSSKAKKYYLCLSFERSYTVPTALGAATAGGAQNAEEVQLVQRNSRQLTGRKGSKQRKSPKSNAVDWIMRKKEKQRRLGKAVKADSKYTGRKRSTPF